jgi:two-component system, NtrC family, response regulator GlrR
MSESGTEPFDQPRAWVTQFRLAVDGSGAPFVSASDRAVVGTHESCDVAVADRTVSRFHCEIVVRDGRARVRDLGSKNGTFVDGVPVLEAFLDDGARLGVGQTVMHFHIGGAEVPIPLSRAGQFGLLVGRSAEMRHVFALLERAAQSTATLLIEGETGTGKEAAAESVHRLSPRREQPFVVVDCSALPPHLLESELFGHEKGAFTGAATQRIGAFEAAHGGTVFLDEIGELSPELQPKLLRVLERQEVKRIGADRYKKVDTRIVAATHRNLRSDVNSKRFRSDLYYRLAVVVVTLPPLRDRVEDLPLLVEHLLASLGAAARPEAARLRTPAYVAELGAHRWPGNVRELRNYLERSLALSGTAAPPRDAPASYKTAKERWERAYVEELLRAADGNVAAAAREAKLDRAAFYRLLWRHGMR